MSEALLLLPGFDPASGSLTVPWWVATAAAVFVVVALIVSMLRGGPAVLVGGLVGIASLLLVASVVWTGNERVVERDRAEARHALAMRAQDLAREAAMPGSALGCLDAAIGDAMEAACERVLFASPETVAGATAFTAARIGLLSDGVESGTRLNASSDALLAGLRAALESDRYGFVAQVLIAQYGCSSDRCDALTLFRDGNRISANLKDKPFDVYVGKNVAAWSQRATQTANPSQGPTRVPLASGGSPVPPGFNVPSASSIPAVSIMVPETTAPANNAAAASGDAAPPTAPRRPPATKTARPAQPRHNAPATPAPANTGSANTGGTAAAGGAR